MLRRSNARPTAQRRAAILLVTIVMLMLFLVIGMCFLIFAEAQATSSRIYREASLHLADEYPTPEEMLAFSLGEIIYDVPDDTGAYSAIRGHSLARNMYGWNYVAAAGGTMTGVNNETPFNGAGRPSTGAGTYMNPLNVDDKALINYTYWSGDGFKRDPERNASGLFTGGFNAPYTYPDLNNVYLAALSANNPANPTVPQVLIPSFWRGNHNGFGAIDPANPNWNDPNPAFKYLTLRPRPIDNLLPTETAADLPTLFANNQIFPMPATPTGDVINLPGGLVPDSIWVDLGFPVVRLAATNRKIKPMFAFLIVDMDGRVNMNVAGNVRESAGNDYHGSNQGFGPWEINPRRLMEDVANPFAPPATFARLGSAVLYQDLFRGNARAAGRYGQKPGVPVDYPQFGTPSTFPVPNASNLNAAVPGNSPLYYAKADLDASSVIRPATTGIRAPVTVATANSYNFFPTFPTYYQNGLPDERYYHPSLFNPFQLNRAPPIVYGTNEADRLLPIADIQKLIAWSTPALAAGVQPTNPPFPISPDTLNCALGQLWANPPTVGGQYDGNLERYPKLRNLITMLSSDLDRPGCAPGQTNNPLPPFTGAVTYLLDASQPAGSATRLPQSAQGSMFNSASAPATALFANRNAIGAPGGDLRDNDWRSALADLGRVDLNRKLTKYPAPLQPGYTLNTSDANVLTQLNNAIRDRQLLAMDIFDRLRLSTGASLPSNFTGSDPGTLPPSDSNRQQFEALRFLAQLAVNMVDYIDSDDVMTAFNFLPGGNLQWGWVFGTEMPRLVINEAYGQIQNHPDDDFSNPLLAFAPGDTSDPDTTNTDLLRPFKPQSAMAKATMKYRVNYFVELHNPHQADPNMSEGGAARLQFSAADPNPALSGQPHGIYKVVIQSQVDPVATRDPGNVLGNPMPAAGGTIPSVQVLDFTSDGAAPPMGVDPTVVLPSNGQYGDLTTNNKRNTGYFVLGPSEKASTKFPRNWQADFPYDRNPMTANPVPFTPTVAVKDQTFGAVDSKLYAEVDNTFNLTTLPANQPSIFLQRLANPTLPPQPNPTQPLYNPYITVDYMTPPAGSSWLNDAVLYDSAGPRNAAGNERQPMNGGANNRISIGRRQPFRATDFSKQMLATPSIITVDNTFFTQNGDTTTGPVPPAGNSKNTLDNQFEWLVHFDRNVTSPMDMLYVSMYHPHELMQQFIPAGSGPNPATAVAHQQTLRVAVSNPATRLYRAMEMLGVHSWMHGVPFGGKIPGKININTVWADTASGDSLVLRALADSYDTAQRSNAFTQSESETLFQQFLAARTPGGVPSLADQPVWSLAMPNPSGQDLQYGTNPPGVTGLTKTLLGRDLVGANVGGTPAAQVHPYLKDDLLRKIFNNITTRSNVFAVYVTTGFFTVRDDSTQPVKLGGEVDPQLRHKMFAIVDRTNLSLDKSNNRLQGGRPIFFGLNPINPGAPGTHGNLTVNAQNELNFQQTAVGGSVVETVVPIYSFVGTGPNAVVTIRDTVDHNGQEFSNTSGEKFDISPGTVLFLDVASKMEAVVVTEVYPPVAGDASNPLSLATIKFTKLGGGNLSFTHYMGCAICTQRLGNPGPQPGISIDYSLPPYANTVVPFSTILQ